MHHLIFIANLLIPSRLTIDNAGPLVSDVWTATALEEGTVSDARRALVWVAKESGGLSVVGDCADHKFYYWNNSICKACGAGQLHIEWWGGNTCDAILGDRILAIRLWIRMLHHLEKYCGTTEKALAAVACGSCSGSEKFPKVKAIVVNRERLAFQ